MKIKLFLIGLFVLVSNLVISQNKNHLQDINTQVWEKFTKAFQDLDYSLFESIHSDDLVRVSGNGKSVRNKEAYLNIFKNQWENASFTQTITFRFLERITNDTKASERGIYKLTRNPNTDEKRSYYGKFHVILTKENDTWEILVDYDSSENNTINEDSYNNAFAIDDFDKY